MSSSRNHSNHGRKPATPHARPTQQSHPPRDQSPARSTIVIDTKWAVVLGLMLAAFFGALAYAQSGRTPTDALASATVPQAASQSLAAPASGGGGCCGGGVTAPASAQAPKAAVVSGGVQKISVDVSKGYYDPSNIQLKAGVPAEITFGRASGCTGIVQSQQLGFSEDLSGGPKTVKLAALAPGTYSFACGMDMVTGSITVK